MSPRILIWPPALPVWAEQVAGILPLAALIEFIDVPSKLHSFELAASVPLWNWPVTPAGARLLFSSEDNVDACCLDAVGRSKALHCIDGRYGDMYPSSTPTTTRLWAEPSSSTISIRNDSPNLLGEHIRPQQLEVVVLTRIRQSPLSRLTTRINSKLSPALESDALNRASVRSIKYAIMSAFGWTCWMGATVVSLMAGLYVAAAYLILMPLTGYLVGFTHGSMPRQMTDKRPAEHMRMVVATDSVNGSRWQAFYGGSFALNSLLNKPLYRAGVAPPTSLWHHVSRMLLRVLILGQWALGVASCALQDWNALVIVMWLALCILSSAYGYPPQMAVQDWLQNCCHLRAQRLRADFSTRRAMLSALVYLNPDSKEGRTSWIDPILRPTEDRTAWEAALLSCMGSGLSKDSTAQQQYWWRFIEEGMEMGRRIETVVRARVAEAAAEESATIVEAGPSV